MSQPAGDGPRAARGKLWRQTFQGPKTRASRRRHSLLRETAGILVSAIVVSLLIRTVLVQAFFIPSGSMEPTLHGCPGCLGDKVLVSRLTTHLGGVHRGDIVVFRDSSGWLNNAPSAPTLQSRIHDGLAFIGLGPATSESDLIKRVIGVGGDTVEGRGGKVYVNGAPLSEPYVFAGNSPTEINFRVKVPVGKLWVMGDHRSESADSRFHQGEPGKGFVPVDDVVGRAFVIVWPLDRIGSLDRPATFENPPITAKR